ncbi:hypothetical protein JIN82_10150 [Persicirhabdus sediminis]|uniref:Uncharacterized protein n=1 Tax=Persicirhabdus sediminis TaxID=454144 RepID=A0A8J7MF05_9BACT|nr:hypothetical protein [Persicirhabdus sediminis]
MSCVSLRWRKIFTLSHMIASCALLAPSPAAAQLDEKAQPVPDLSAGPAQEEVYQFGRLKVDPRLLEQLFPTPEENDDPFAAKATVRANAQHAINAQHAPIITAAHRPPCLPDVYSRNISENVFHYIAGEPNANEWVIYQQAIDQSCVYFLLSPRNTAAIEQLLISNSDHTFSQLENSAQLIVTPNTVDSLAGAPNFDPSVDPYKILARYGVSNRSGEKAISRKLSQQGDELTRYEVTTTLGPANLLVDQEISLNDTVAIDGRDQQIRLNFSVTNEHGQPAVYYCGLSHDGSQRIYLRTHNQLKSVISSPARNLTILKRMTEINDDYKLAKPSPQP